MASKFAFPNDRDQIIYMNQYYPTPLFVKFQFFKKQQQQETQESSFLTNSSLSSQNKLKTQAKKFIDQDQCFSNKNNYQMSQIPKKNIQDNRSKQKKSFHESQLEYKQLLEDLDFNQTHQKNYQGSQKFNNFEGFQQISNNEKSQNHQNIQLFNDFCYQTVNAKKKTNQIQIQLVNSHKKLNRSKYAWDPPYQMQLKKRIHLKKVSQALNRSVNIIFLNCFKKILKNQRPLTEFSFCKRCYTLLNKTQNDKIRYCQTCKIKVK